MTTKKPPAEGARAPEKTRRKPPLIVVGSRGHRQRFLRGVITHDLVQRGLDFDTSYAVARALRDRLAGREEVTTAELRDLIRTELEGRFDGQLPAHLETPVRQVPERWVLVGGQRQPFSRGLLATSIHAAGLDLDRAYRLVTDLEAELRRDGVAELTSQELARRTAELLERFEGVEAARRYRLVRRLHRLPRPLVFYVGGASGTGKSTLALELAPLLRIYRVNSTDTIRQVMRMVFSPQILPGLHTSSFELASAAPALGVDELPGLPEEADFSRRLIASFEEQSIRVGVGVRAVVERAIAENMSILVEGVHLYPPLVPFGDLEGAIYQVPLMLAIPDVELHRSRFLGRSRLSGRLAERYLENFSSIRTIHDFLIHQAETHDVPLVDTSYDEPPLARTLRLITGVLRSRLPALGEAQEAPEAPVPTLVVVVDGLADRPVRALGGRTPLQAARTPTLDRLASEGQSGLADPVAPGVVPDTAAGTLALFGQSPLAMKRGPVEALGAGLTLAPGDLALRGNLATLDERGWVIDRRAGRIREETTELARALDRLALPGGLGERVEVRVRAATEHRLAIVLRGEGLSSAILGSDPGDGAEPGPALVPRPVDPRDERAIHTARLLAIFEQEARRVLAAHPINRRRAARGLPLANGLLTRGAGRIHRLLPLEAGGSPLRVVCLSGDHTVLGLAGWLGAETLTRPEWTANLDTDLKGKFEAAAAALERADLVVVHVKGADIAAHDRRPDLKVAFLERLDRRLGKLLEKRKSPLRVVVASDHATLSESGQHAADPLPILTWGEGIVADDVATFDETAAAAGALQRFPLQMLLGRLFPLS